MATCEETLTYLLQEVYGLKRGIIFSRLTVENLRGELYRVACHCFEGYVLILEDEIVPNFLVGIPCSKMQVTEYMESLKNKKVYFFNDCHGRAFLENYVPEIVEFIVNRNISRFGLTEEQIKQLKLNHLNEVARYYHPDREKEVINSKDIQHYICC